MLNYYQKNTVANHLKRSSLQQNSLNLSSKFYQSQNDKRSSYSHLYPRKAVSTDKHSYYNSKKSLSKPNSISANKQIQGKKLASSSQFYNSGSNINFNLIKGNNTFCSVSSLFSCIEKPVSLIDFSERLFHVLVNGKSKLPSLLPYP